MLGIIVLASAAVAAQSSPGEAEAEQAEEIVVTGERVRRTLRETASSVYVVTADDIEARPLDRLEQALMFVPNVQLGDGSEGPTIRGLDTTGALRALPAFLGGNRPRTTVVLDGRPLTYNEFIFGIAPLWDVRRVEVYRTPQTTTQGQNSIAGAIFLYTNEPTFEPEYRAQAILGNYNTYQLSALASGPVIDDELAIRVAGDLRYSHTTSRIADRLEEADPNHDVYGVLRTKLLATPAGMPNSRLMFTYSHLQSQAPQIVGVRAPFRERRDPSGFYGTFRINVDSVTAAFRNESKDLTTNVVLTAGNTHAQRLAFPGAGESRINGRDWSAEAVVDWSPEGPLQLVGGLSNRHTTLKQFIDLSVFSGVGRFRDRQEGSGVFAEASLAVFDRATITAGFRYQRDRQERNGALGTATGAIDLQFDRSFDAWLPKVSIAYDFTPNVRAGVLVQKAYNPGGTTLRLDTGAPDHFEAESLWDYEMFARAVMADGRITATANLFYYDMHNAQRAQEIVVTGPNGFPVRFADLFNVPRAHSYGLEATVEWKASRRLSASVAVGLLHTKITRTSDESSVFHSKEFQRAPHLSAAAAVQWRPAKDLQLSAQVRHHSAYFSDARNRPDLRIGSATIVDGRAAHDFGAVTAFAYARNLFDTFALTELFDPLSGVAEDPRQVGIGIQTRF